MVIAVGGLREIYLGTQDDADVLYLKNWYKKVCPNISLVNVIMKFSVLEFPCLIFICFRHKKPACELWINFPAFVIHLICICLYRWCRRGFLQIAMDEKTGVVPVYTFNENQVHFTALWFVA